MRQIVVLSVALVLSLGWAYLTWTDDTEEVSDEVALVYDAKPSDLQKLAWNSKDLKVSIERKKDSLGEYLWVETSEVKLKHPKKDKPPAHPGEEQEPPEQEGGDAENPSSDEKPEAPAEGTAAPEGTTPEGTTPEGTPAAEPEEPPEWKSSRFMASAQGEELWKSFAPLKALRELDTTGADPSTFGFGPDDPVTTIEVVKDGAPITLRVGGETYGNKDRYVQLGEETFLVDDATLRPLQYAATRLVERSLYPLEEKDIEQVEVAMPSGLTLAYVHQNKDDAAKAFWSKPDSPDTADEVAATWLDKVFKLKLRDYVDESTLTAPLEPVVTFSVSGKGDTWKVELLKVTTGEDTEWYARTAYNRSLVSLTESVVRNVVDDLDELTE